MYSSRMSACRDRRLCTDRPGERIPPDKGGRIPAVALTAYGRAVDRIRALSAGFHMHIPKPVEPAELATVIASLTGRAGKQTSGLMRRFLFACQLFV